MKVISFVIVSTLFVSCSKNDRSIGEKHTLFRFGYRTSAMSTGPLYCSGFIGCLGNSAPPMFFTAHHVVNKEQYTWDQLAGNVKDGWLWSQRDTSVNLALGKNIPIRDAHVSHIDIAAFEINPREELGCLPIASRNANVGDSIRLFGKLLFDKKDSGYYHPAKIIYVSDSFMVYAFNRSSIELGASSGSPLLNKANEVVGIAFGALKFPSLSIRDQIAKQLPVINELILEENVMYGIGTPVEILQDRVRQSLRSQKPTATR